MKWREETRRMKSNKNITINSKTVASRNLTQKHLARFGRLRAFLQAFFYFFSIFILFATFNHLQRKLLSTLALIEK